MSLGFGFALPAYPLRGGGGNNPFNQSGPTLDLSFVDGATNVGDLSNPNGYTLNTNFITPQYQVAAQYVVWETGVGLVDKTFSQIITFTRASTGTFFDSAGVLQTAAIDAPRFDYNPDTLAARGLLIEEARTNLLTRSEELNDASWVVADITVTANNTTAPNGTTTADLLTEGTAGTAFITRSASATVSAGATVTGSFFVKRSSVIQWLRVRLSNDSATNGGNVWFDIQNGVLGNQTNLGSGTATSGTITLINNGWYRVTVTTTLAVGDTTALLLFTSASGNGSTTRVNNSAYWGWGAQLEAGAFPTSYIPTTTTALTRSADVASVNTLSPWYNQTEGTVYAELQSLSPLNGAQSVALGKYPHVWQIEAGASDSSLWCYGVVSELYISTTFNNIGTVPSGINKFAVSLAASGGQSRSSLNGAAAVNRNGTLAGTATGFFLGRDSTAGLNNFLNGYLRRLTYYPRALSAAELQAITA